MYYCSTTFLTSRSAIGLATSLTGEPGSWTDHGLVIDSPNNTKEWNAIDPNLFVDPDTGIWYLTFGSYFGGLYQVELDPSTGKIKDAAKPYRIAYRIDDPVVNSIEAAFLIKKGKYLMVEKLSNWLGNRSST
jgi:arabinan endo-1,5-alpha-L-arabinosidase